MLLDGFGFSGYRSIGDDFVKIAPLKKINFIIGQNNSGKSNIVKFLKEHLKGLASSLKGGNNSYTGFLDLDRHIAPQKVRTRFGFPLRMDSSKFEKYLVDRLPPNDRFRDDRGYKELLKKLFLASEFLDGNGYIWFIYESSSLNGTYRFSADLKSLGKKLRDTEWNQLWERMTGFHSGSLERD